MCYIFNLKCYVFPIIFFNISLVNWLVLNNSSLCCTCDTVFQLLFKLFFLVPVIANKSVIWPNFLALLNSTYKSSCSFSLVPNLIQYFLLNVPPCAFHTIQLQEGLKRSWNHRRIKVQCMYQSSNRMQMASLEVYFLALQWYLRVILLHVKDLKMNCYHLYSSHQCDWIK